MKKQKREQIESSGKDLRPFPLMILGNFGDWDDDEFADILDEIINDRKRVEWERPTLTLDLPEDDFEVDVPDVEETPRVIIIDPEEEALESTGKRVVIIDL